MELLWTHLSHVFLLCFSVLIVLESWSWGTLTLSWGKERLILDGKTLGSVWCSGFTSHNLMEKWSHCRLLQFLWSAVGLVHTQNTNLFFFGGGGGDKKLCIYKSVCVCVCIYTYTVPSKFIGTVNTKLLCWVWCLSVLESAGSQVLIPAEHFWCDFKCRP